MPIDICSAGGSGVGTREIDMHGIAGMKVSVDGIHEAASPRA